MHVTNQQRPQDRICDMRQYFKDHPLLAQLLPTTGVILECDAQAPSPSKDYGQLQINLDRVKTD